MSYKTAFGQDYELGIRIPGYFQDHSYRHDIGPCFIFRQNGLMLQIWVQPEIPSTRDYPEGYRYTLIKLVDDADQSYLGSIIETETPAEFEAVINDEDRLRGLLE